LKGKEREGKGFLRIFRHKREKKGGEGGKGFSLIMHGKKKETSPV